MSFEAVPTPPIGITHFGDAEPMLTRYAQLVAGIGVERGLVGPREVGRLWERHIFNCAVVADVAEGLVPTDATVIDVGTGAGLPGLVWSLVRTDISVILVESMKRRTDFLELAVAELEVGDRVSVLRGRAEDLRGQIEADVVTARAVAPLPKLVGWLLPLTVPGGSIVAFKGEQASAEVAEASSELAAAGVRSVRIVECGMRWLEPPATVVVMKGRGR